MHYASLVLHRHCRRGSGNVRALPIDGVEANCNDLDEDFAIFQNCRHEVVGDKGIGLLGGMNQKGSLTVQNGRGLEGFLFLLDYNRGFFELDVGIGGGGVHSPGGGGRRGGHGCSNISRRMMLGQMRLSTITMKYRAKKKKKKVYTEGGNATSRGKGIGRVL